MNIELYLLSTSYLSLLTVIVLYNLLLALFKKNIAIETLQKLALFTVIFSLLTSGLGFLYRQTLEAGNIVSAYPPRFEAIHGMVASLYAPILFLTPLLTLVLLFSIKKDRKTVVYIGTSAIVLQIAILIATILI